MLLHRWSSGMSSPVKTLCLIRSHVLKLKCNILNISASKASSIIFSSSIHVGSFESISLCSKSSHDFNSSSCTTTVLSKLLTSCLTAVEKHWIRYYDTVYERDGINYFWSIKNSNDVLNKFKSKKLSGF